MTHTRRTLSRALVALGVLLACGRGLPAADPPDLAEYRTVDRAITTRVSLAAAPGADQAAYLGVVVAPDPGGRLVVSEVQPNSPAARAGLQAGDVLVRAGGQALSKPEVFREWLLERGPGAEVRLEVTRQGRPLELTATLAAASRPMKLGAPRVVLGVQFGDPRDDGTPVERVLPGSPAETAGLKANDLVLKIDGTPLTRAARVADVLAEKKPGDTVAVVLRRDGKEAELRVVLTAERDRGPFGRNAADPAPPLWKKDVYRLAVVGVDFADVKHNPKVSAADWERALFSRNTYSGKTSATGQAVHGSLNDYYQEQSCGAFHVEGKVFDPVEVGKKRAEYSQGSGTSNKSVLLTEALDRLLAREGKEALKDFDGLFFVYAGERVATNRGALYYPHSGSVTHRGRRWPYMLAAEGGPRMAPLGSFCREFGYLLGLPDLSARPENPGSAGLGVWCAMSNPLPDGRPQHLSAWCKEQLGWLKPAVIDPTVKQKLILGPVEDSPRECLKVLVRPDGSEYLLLENRRKKGFDQGLPAEGLLIWRVVENRPTLEASHGVEGPSAPRVLLDAVPYPSPANNAFRPATTPSSRSPHGGGLPVHITEIRRLADGRIALQVGYEYE